ncbi:hypothetical protein F2Q69_00011377 [Brassica cretica]|uniref:Pre-mRNA-processing factor 19 n=1 Tax=Brassica cretica TaxID=69181 RepID=A0A8S9R5M5_BRACR|nr:hypothetical protein F2Q69_00011377 [Brassica cretica]
MNCAISGEVPEVPVVSTKSGLLFEKRLIESHISDYGKCPVTGEPLTIDDIVPIKSGKVIKPKLLHTASIPGLLGTFQNIPETLASVDALGRFTQLSSHPLHKTNKPGICSMDILHSKDVIATGGIDATAVIFDRPSGQILSTLTGHSKKVTSVKFVGDSDLVLTASADKTVRVWRDSGDGQYACGHTLNDHSEEVRAVTVHATNKYFVSASLDSTWCFYDLSSGLCLAKVADDSEKVDYTAAAFHPDGLILGTGTSQSVVKIWDVKSQANVARFDGHTGEVTSISFSENGYFLATAAEDGVKLWDLRKLRNFRSFSSADANSGRLILTESELVPSSSEVANKKAKERSQANDTESSILSEWSLEDDRNIEGLRSKLERWRTELPPLYDIGSSHQSSDVGREIVHVSVNGGGGKSSRWKAPTVKKKKKHNRRHTEGGNNLFSCFSNLCGVECTFVCGGGSDHDGSKKKGGSKRLPPPLMI